MSISWKHQLSICTNKLDLKTLIVPEFMAHINIGKKKSYNPDLLYKHSSIQRIIVGDY